MSVNSNFKKDKCWSCEYYCGKREYKKGILLGDSVQTEYGATCNCKRSSNYNKPINDDNWCSKYQKWGVLQSALAVEQQRVEAQKIEYAQKREQQRVEDERNQLERQQRREQERRNKEEMLSSMSNEERAAFLRKEQEQAESRRQEYALKQKQNEIKRKKLEIEEANKLPIKYLILEIILTVILFVLAWIPHWILNSQAMSQKEMYDTYVYEWGHSSTEQMSVELYDNYVRFSSLANAMICIPFIVVAVMAVIIVFAYRYEKKKTNNKIDKLSKEIKDLEKNN